MFEITRNEPFVPRMRDLMSWVRNDPFLGMTNGGVDEGTLAVDVSEQDGDIIVRASLPGFRQDDIEVQIHNGVLSIKAEQTEETETKDEKFYHRERRFGSVSRRIALPGLVSEKDARAEFKDGVLILRIPQGEDAKPKKIKIQ